jgi:hypothetical protein
MCRELDACRSAIFVPAIRTIDWGSSSVQTASLRDAEPLVQQRKMDLQLVLVKEKEVEKGYKSIRVKKCKGQ